MEDKRVFDTRDIGTFEKLCEVIDRERPKGMFIFLINSELYSASIPKLTAKYGAHNRSIWWPEMIDYRNLSTGMKIRFDEEIKKHRPPDPIILVC